MGFLAREPKSSFATSSNSYDARYFVNLENDDNWGDRNPYSYRPEWNPPLPKQGVRHLIPEGYHGRWELLTVEDFCFLNECGISVL